MVSIILTASVWAQAPAPNAPASGALPPPGGSIPGAAGRAGRGRGPAVPQGPAPRLPDGKPDFSGVWRPDNGLVGDISRILKPGDQIVLKPEAEKLMKSRKAGQDPEANCLPTGVPRMAPYPWTIAIAPGRLFFLFEGNIHSYRTIPIRRGMAIRLATGRVTRWWWIQSGSTICSGSILPATLTPKSCTSWNVTRGRTWAP
jgi:hypothetical protein